MSKDFWPVTFTPFEDVADSPEVREQIALLDWYLRQIGARCTVTDNGDGTFTHRWDVADQTPTA